MTAEKLGRVLCVNDNDITLFILKQTLNKSNFAREITGRKDGSEALKYCHHLINSNVNFMNLYPGLIFLDLHMPVMDGWEFMERFSDEIWPLFKETRIVITSQSISNYDLARAREFSFIVDFLNAPITVAYLRQLHSNLVNNTVHLQ